jgi:hypothetical protein
MDDNIESVLEDLTCEMWAMRTIIVELLADKLEKSKNPKKAADLMASRVYDSYKPSSLPDPIRLKLPEIVVSILDDATRVAVSPNRRGREGG